MSVWNELVQKIKASVLVKIEAYREQNAAGIDVLDVKNSLLLSYVLELTVWHHRQCRLVQSRSRNSATSDDMESLQRVLATQWPRLVELRIALDKLRALEKSLRYQIDKLLAHHNDSGTTVEFAESSTKDPLQFRPEALDQVEDDDDEEDGEDDGEDGDDDDDLAVARRTLSKHSQTKHKQSEQEDESDGIYRAPRHSATPYPHGRHETDMDEGNRDDVDDKLQRRRQQDDRERLRLQRKLQLSEVADTLRSTYSDGPDVEDTQGGAAVLGGGRHSATTVAAKQWQQRHTERTHFEEEHMIRLTVSRAEKKERQKIQRQEQSNLNSMTDLGNLARDVQQHARLKRSLHSSSTNDNMEEDAPKRRYQRMGGAPTAESTYHHSKSKPSKPARRGRQR